MLPVYKPYRVSIAVADGQMENPPLWGFSGGYTLAYIKERVNVHLGQLGYRLVRLRQELGEGVSIEVRSEQLLAQIIRRAQRLEENPLIELVAYVIELP